MKFAVVAHLDNSRSVIPVHKAYLEEADSVAHLMAKLDAEEHPDATRDIEETTKFFSEMFHCSDGRIIDCLPGAFDGHSEVYIDGFGAFDVFCLDALGYPINKEEGSTCKAASSSSS